MPGPSALADSPGFVFKPLSKRQCQALSLAAIGHTDVQAARAMGVAARTLRGYLQEARERLGAINTTHAVAIAVFCRLINFGDLGAVAISPGGKGGYYESRG